MAQVPQQVLEIHAILERYVAIHDAIFEFSWRKLLPIPGLFQPIDYGRYARELTELMRSLFGIIDSRQERPLSTGALEYAVALSNTIGSLLEICHNLYKKSQGYEGYDHAKYRADLAKYHTWVEKYRALGLHLNRQLA